MNPRRPTVPGIPGMSLPIEERFAQVKRELDEERRATERLVQRQAELVREKSERPQPMPPVEQAPVIVQGNGWRANVPAGIIIAIVAALGARYAPTQTASDHKLDRIENRQERQTLEAERERADRERSYAAILQRLDRIETRQSEQDVRLDELRRRLSQQ